ncbi:MAG: protein-disulfide reductase DsbD N-terminal domain-containing protein [Betaproteobacteria bacterium]|nr:protein-disulfide reductase DsbD N-terminal domain-containing protein [Betaproteobacteria bacterium]
MKRSLSAPLSLLITLLGLTLAGTASASGEELLAPEQAFGAKARATDARAVEVKFDIAPDHYLYRHRFKIEADGKLVPASRIVIPKGKTKKDPTFGRVQTHEGALTLTLRGVAQKSPSPVMLKVVSQGCAAKAGVCYPPFTQTFELAASSRDWVAAQSAATGEFAGKLSVKNFVKTP